MNMSKLLMRLKTRLSKSPWLIFVFVMTGIASLLFVTSIWTGDLRFAQTAAIPALIAFFAGIVWVIKEM